MTIVWWFLGTPLGRWLLLGAFGLALIVGSFYAGRLHQSAVDLVEWNRRVAEATARAEHKASEVSQALSDAVAMVERQNAEEQEKDEAHERELAAASKAADDKVAAALAARPDCPPRVDPSELDRLRRQYPAGPLGRAKGASRSR